MCEYLGGVVCRKHKYTHKLLQENYQVALKINVEKLMQPVPTNEPRSPKRHVTLIQDILISYCKYAQTPFRKRDLGTRLADAMV